MAISLYDATVPSWRQLVGGAAHFIEKAEQHFLANKVDLADIVQSRLFPDMFPFNAQVMLVHVHSIGAVEAVKKGSFAPPRDRAPPADYAACRKLIEDTNDALAALSRSEVDDLQGRDVILQLGDNKLPFLAEGFFF